MLNYRDITFCNGDGCTKFDTCPRALTDKVKEEADKWWGGDKGSAPISTFCNPKELDCYSLDKPYVNEIW